MKVFSYRTNQARHGGEGIIIASDNESAKILLKKYINSLDKYFLPKEYDDELKEIRKPILILEIIDLSLEHEQLIEFEDGLCC